MTRSLKLLFYKIISKHTFPIYRLFHLILFIFAFPYTFIIIIRNILYEKQILASEKINIPIISIGNISLGGTGKTPFSFMLSKSLKKYDVKIVSKGYGNDEYITTSNNKFINKNKLKICKYVSQKYPKGCILIDDGFQSLKIKRDIDIVLIDASSPFLNLPFPAGQFREPPYFLKRANIIVFTKVNLIPQREFFHIKKFFKPSVYKKPLFCSTYNPVELIDLKSNCKTLSLNYLCNKDVLAFCSIGNPYSFSALLKKLDVNISEIIIFPDHHKYIHNDIQYRILPKCKNVDCIITTEKDMVKILNFIDAFPLPLFVLRINTELDEINKFLSLIQNNLPS